MVRLRTALLLCLMTSLPAADRVPAGELSSIPWTEASLGAHQRVSQKLKTALRRKNLQFGSPVFMRIFKQEKELEVWIRDNRRFTHFKTYTICDLSGQLGPKLAEGDKQSPEGFYTVTAERMHPKSKYHLAFNLGYPNEYDLSHSRTGSAIMVHGRCSSAGCFAMTDFRMDEIYTLAASALNGGQDAFAVHIFPFRMNEDNLQANRNSSWLPFWQNLKEGYDIFESTRIPPAVTVEDMQYRFPYEHRDIHAYQEATVNGKS